MVERTYNPSTQEMKAGGRESKATLCHTASSRPGWAAGKAPQPCMCHATYTAPDGFPPPPQNNPLRSMLLVLSCCTIGNQKPRKAEGLVQSPSRQLGFGSELISSRSIPGSRQPHRLPVLILSSSPGRSVTALCVTTVGDHKPGCLEIQYSA